VTEPGGPTSPDRQAGPAPRRRISLEELAEELADLDAGLLTEEEEKRLRSRIAQDPAAAEMLAALAQVHDDLGALGQLDDEVPDDVVARLDAAVAAEAATARHDTAAGDDSSSGAGSSPAAPGAPDPGAPPVIDLSASRQREPRGARSSRMRRFTVGALSVAAAAVVIAVGSGVIRGMQPPEPQPGSAPNEAIMLSSTDLPAQWPGISQIRDLGFLVPPGELEQCLATSLGFSDLRVLGARPVVIEDQYGVLVAVPAVRDDPDGDVRLIVLGPHCDVDRDVIAETVVPR
jgi:hypothetical protein